MSKQQETLRLALEALETSLYPQQKQLQAITAIREALAQPEHSPNCALLKIPSKDCDCQDQQEPVAITITGKLGNIYSFTGDYSLKKGDKVYTTPPQRTWVGLTDEEIILIVADCASSHQHTDIHFARAIEAKLKAKNA